MISFLSSRLSRTLGVVALIGVGTAPALGTDLSPGGTLEPIPLTSLPSGATLEGTYTRDYDVSWTQLPFVRHVTGTVTQNVYRLTDNTLLFRYYISNDSDSDGAVTRFGATNFGAFDTDVSLASSIICFNCENADRARRDIFGTGVSFEWDLGIATGNNSRAMYVRTNATSYRVASGRIVPVNSGRVSISVGDHFTSMYGFAYPVIDTTPPVAEITGPGGLAHSCPPVTITGRAFDTAGFDSYTLEYSTTPNGPWTQIGEYTQPVNPTGTLGVWNANVPEGYYFIRLSALNTAELTSSVTSVVYVDRAMSPVVLRSPTTGNPVLGGSVCFDGTVWDAGGSAYTIQYRALPGGSFANVNPGTPTYAGQIITDGLGSWTTSSGPTAVVDGLYQVRVTGTDGCGNTSSVTRDVRIDNTPPIAFISSPTACSYADGIVTITGTVTDANLSGWSLLYTGGDSHSWTTIASGTGPVVNGVLGQWNTNGLRTCSYTLWLVAGDAASVNCGSTNNQTNYYTSVSVGCPSDFNRDGVNNSQDFFDFLQAFFSPCP